MIMLAENWICKLSSMIPSTLPFRVFWAFWVPRHPSVFLCCTIKCYTINLRNKKLRHLTLSTALLITKSSYLYNFNWLLARPTLVQRLSAKPIRSDTFAPSKAWWSVRMAHSAVLAAVWPCGGLTYLPFGLQSVRSPGELRRWWTSKVTQARFAVSLLNHQFSSPEKKV